MATSRVLPQTGLLMYACVSPISCSLPGIGSEFDQVKYNKCSPCIMCGIVGYQVSASAYSKARLASSFAVMHRQRLCPVPSSSSSSSSFFCMLHGTNTDLTSPGAYLYTCDKRLHASKDCNRTANTVAVHDILLHVVQAVSADQPAA